MPANLPHEKFRKDMVFTYSDAVEDELRLRDLRDSLQFDEKKEAIEKKTARIKVKEEAIRRRIGRLAALPEVSCDSIAGYYPLFDGPRLVDYANSLIHWWTGSGRRSCIRVVKDAKAAQQSSARGSRPLIHHGVTVDTPRAQYTQRIKQATKELERIQRYLVKYRAGVPVTVSKSPKPIAGDSQPALLPTDSREEPSIEKGILKSGNLEQRLAEFRAGMIAFSESRHSFMQQILEMEKRISELEETPLETPSTVVVELPPELESIVVSAVEKGEGEIIEVKLAVSSEETPSRTFVDLPPELKQIVASMAKKEVVPLAKRVHARCSASIDSYGKVSSARVLHMLGTTFVIIEAYLEFCFPGETIRTRSYNPYHPDRSARCPDANTQRPDQLAGGLPAQSTEQRPPYSAQSAPVRQMAIQTISPNIPPANEYETDKGFILNLDVREVARVLGITFD